MAQKVQYREAVVEAATPRPAPRPSRGRIVRYYELPASLTPDQAQQVVNSRLADDGISAESVQNVRFVPPFTQEA